MNQDNITASAGKDAPQGAPDGPPTARLSLDSVREWMRQDISVRLARGWLVGGAAVITVLTILAMD
ncbi:hypothetical protein ASA1KI_23760 [Opitutales bacterium ASA1]|uniref:hypothetical protein n=1 Tax=Congregicoccus parvus TaxID=3081749 RepID=UPI002B2A1A30|nr:hypothetical protein ASA1KI_23760 [Opitutales bacterium ASA1]